MGNGIGAVMVSPNEDYYPFTSKLDFDCTNNMAEHKAWIMGIRAAIEHKIKVLEVYGDSAPVINQLKGEWGTRDPKLIEYRRLVLELIKKFNDITFCYLPRDENQMADALATLASMVKIKKQEDAIENDKMMLRRLANDYVLDGEILYKRRKEQVLLRCVDVVEAKKILEEVHEGGMDVIGSISAKASNRHRLIFVVINFFTKRVEATSYANVCSQFKIKHYNSSPYRPRMNGVVEAANKNIKKVVGKMTETYKGWQEKLPFALYVYRMSARTFTGVTPFSLVYGIEVVSPIEVEIPSLLVLSQLKFDEVEWI
ncbi:hypothetical protein CXB51_007017 [Gossypium anomalum]|uniref:Integrase catalytic domain-containing protein n=1 Tax=Gossypium anomalum TaxID=47600 RepID=A0A8J5ZCB8_9ROSI|nr:hypothetical protein CXB51_007017 [Gossypium anomalum]